MLVPIISDEDPNLRLVYRLNNELVGTRIQGAAVPMPGTALTMSLEITDDDEPTASYVIEVFSDQVGGAVSNMPVQTLPVTGNGTHTVTVSRTWAASSTSTCA